MRRGTSVALLRLVALATCACAPRASSVATEAKSTATATATAITTATATAITTATSTATASEPREVDGMLLVPAGRFVMGSDDRGELDERPAHEVELPAFYLDASEVTNEAYAACVRAGRCRPPSPKSADAMGFGPDRRFRGPRQPVSSISWDDAAHYCAFIGKRLPTEAEWERAARGDDGRVYPWGNEEPAPERAVFARAVTADVGTHPAGDGPFGHHDLAGNVWEWTADVYDPFAYRREGAARGRPSDCEHALSALNELRASGRRGFTGSNPLPSECERVLRGGGFNYPGKGLRASNRVHHPARYRIVVAGFRCAHDARWYTSPP